MRYSNRGINTVVKCIYTQEGIIGEEASGVGGEEKDGGGEGIIIGTELIVSY